MKLPMPSPLARDGDLSVAIPAGPGKSRARPAPPPAHPGAPTKEPAIDALSARLDPTRSPGAPRWLPREPDRGGPAACPTRFWLPTSGELCPATDYIAGRRA